MKNNLLNIGIIIGGKSVEHDISIISGLQVYHAIDKEKYNVILFYIDKYNNWYTGLLLNDLNTYKEEKYKKLNKIHLYNLDNKIYYKEIRKKKPLGYIDIFLPVVHGEGIEDGTLSSYLTLLNATYTSSNTTSSSIAQDKIYTKIILQNNNINVIPYIGIKLDQYILNLEEKINALLKYPLIIKPARLGSSIGIKTVFDQNLLLSSLQEVSKYGERIIVENLIQNFQELNIALVKEGNKIITSEIEEVIKTDDILTFNDKYINNEKYVENTNRKIPANITEKLKEEIIKTAITTYNALDLNGVVRIDMINDLDNQILYVNEVNTIPGSLAYYLFDKVGINFTKLIDVLIKNAIIKKNQETRFIKTFDSNILSNKSLKLTK